MKLYEDYVACVRKRLLVDTAGAVDAAEAIAKERWESVTGTASRNIIRDTPALKEACAQNDLWFTRDADLRHWLDDQRNG